jgi:MFS family permease
MVLNTPELRALWEKELGDMRLRIKQMRIALVEKLKAAGVKPSAVYTGQYGADPHLSGDTTKPSLSRGVPILEQFEAVRTLVAAPQTFVLVLLALGMATGAVLVPRLAERLPLQMLFLGAVTTFGVAMFAFASLGVYWVAIVFAFTAGFCIACLTVAGNTYVARTVADDIRGRVFTAMESVIRVSLLLSMIVVAPLADLLAALIRRLSSGMSGQSWFTGPRLTLQIASLIVLGAAYYAYRTLNWRRCEDECDE